MTRRIDQVELVKLAIFRLIEHADGMRFDRDAALAFQIHGIQHLGLHLARAHGTGQLQQPVGERGFAMVDVRDDREVTYVPGVHECGYALCE